MRINVLTPRVESTSLYSSTDLQHYTAPNKQGQQGESIPHCSTLTAGAGCHNFEASHPENSLSIGGKASHFEKSLSLSAALALSPQSPAQEAGLPVPPAQLGQLPAETGLTQHLRFAQGSRNCIVLLRPPSQSRSPNEADSSPSEFGL